MRFAMLVAMNFPVELPSYITQLARACEFVAEDVEEQFIKGHGHGGQKVNKTSSCVYLQHLPTGLIVKYQEHREQHQNRVEAWTLLIEKVAQYLKDQEQQQQHEDYVKRQQKRRRSRSSQEGVLKEKKMRGEMKKLRKPL